ncbi:MAG: hypothetical protein KTR25_10860 [Myxococcales bacterium]|nr:hypothetical protein [Myxococcales bacterium]
MNKTPPVAPRALALPRRPHRDEQLAEVIDLVMLPLGARPTPVAYVEWEEVPLLRVLACESYHRCLAFAAQVRWKSFHCRQCPRNPVCGEGRSLSVAAAVEVVDRGD